VKILESTDVGTCRKKLTVEIPPDEVGKELEDIYAEFSRSADVPGFRRGRAPRYVLQMRYGRAFTKEAIRKAAEQGFKEALKEQGLRAVTEPEFDGLENPTRKEDEPITFSGEVEFIPKFELADYSQLRPAEQNLEVTEKEVVETLESLRKSAALYQSVERPVQNGDFVTCSVVATLEGKPFEEASHPEIIIEVGSKRYIKGFEDGLLGATVGETRELDIVLPDDYPVEENRGKQAHFSVTVDEIKVEQLPELDDDFAKDMGDFETIADLKDHIRKGLEQSLESRKEQNLRESIRRQLLDANQFDVPPSMVQARLNYIQAVQDMELRRRGSSLDEARHLNQNLVGQNQIRAEEETRLSLILDEIAKRENLEVSEEDYRVYVSNLARRENVDPVWYFRRIEEQDLHAYYERNALEEKVMNFLMIPPEDRAPAPAPDQQTEESQAAASTKMPESAGDEK